MSLTTNKFYQLRNLTAEVKNENGDYIQKLKEPIKLEEGDQIIMNKAVLDTRSVDSGKIVLENDTRFRINFNYYKVFSSTDGVFEYPPPSTTKLTANDVDGLPYVFCSRVNHATQVYRLNRVSINANGYTTTENWILDIEYRAVDGSYKTAHIQMYRAGFGWDSVSSDLDILAIDSGAGTDPDQLYRLTDTAIEKINEINGDPNSYTPYVVEDPSTASCIPQVYSQFIDIDAGAYDPDDLAERITRGMTLLPQGTEYIDTPTTQQNKLLTTTADHIYISITDRVWVNMYENPQATSPVNYFKYETDTGINQPYFMGTNQFSLEFDEDTRRFKIAYLHFPKYKSGANDIISTFVGIYGSGTKARLVSSEGGIILESLQSIDLTTNKELNLWSDAFGFNITEMCPIPKMIDNTALTALIPRYVASGSIGEYLTQGDSNIDVGVVKANGIAVQAVVGLESIISADQTEPIYAKSNFTQINLSSGYFMIEINGLYNDGLITNTDLKNHIFGIVGRYYENENYTTSSGGSDAIIYQHKGATQYLNQFSVRVLDSNFQLAEGLGDDNTIFLQHIKAVMPSSDKNE